jgi:hypothetical protein
MKEEDCENTDHATYRPITTGDRENIRFRWDFTGVLNFMGPCFTSIQEFKKNLSKIGKVQNQTEPHRKEYLI